MIEKRLAQVVILDRLEKEFKQKNRRVKDGDGIAKLIATAERKAQVVVMCHVLIQMRLTKEEKTEVIRRVKLIYELAQQGGHGRVQAVWILLKRLETE